MTMTPARAPLKRPDRAALRSGAGAPHDARMSETILDVKGMACPLPVLRANRELRGLAPGARLRVLATDRAAVADFQAYCRETGHALIAWSEEKGGVFSFVIRRRAEPPA
jgi:tRNA 2-thiouridine synthesizing protein A